MTEEQKDEKSWAKAQKIFNAASSVFGKATTGALKGLESFLGVDF